MLILHAAQTYPPQVGGVSEVVRQISERLARRGHEVHVATSSLPGTSAEEEIRGVHVHRFAVRGNAVTGIYGDAKAYLDFVLSRHWDVSAFHCAQTWSTDLLLDAPFPGNRIFVAHGLSAFHDPAYKTYFSRLAEWIRCGKAAVSIASDGIEDRDFFNDFQLPESIVIPNGIDIDEWSGPTLNMRKELGAANRPWLLNVSNHSPAKGHRQLFDLMKAIANPSIKLTQIGRSFPADRYNLGRIGVQGGCWYSCKLRSYLYSNVQLEPALPRHKVISALREADIMVLTSRWEASPLVVLESMAAGTPFVTFDVGCVRGHAGGVVVGSTGEMAQAVLELLRDGDRRRSLGIAGMNRAKERHDWEIIATQYESLYRISSEIGTEYVQAGN